MQKQTKTKVQEYYDKVACHYGQDVDNEYYFKTNFLPLWRWYNIVGKNVLDVGCGTGRFTELLHTHQASVMGIDFSEEMIKNRKKEHGFMMFRMKMDEIDFRPNKFDIVTAIGSLEYHDHIIPVLCEIRRVLKNNGVFYFNIHRRVSHVQLLRKFKKKTRDWEYNLFSYRQIKRMLSEVGFKIEHVKPTYFLPMKHNSVEIDDRLSKIPVLRNLSAMFVVGAKICK